MPLRYVVLVVEVTPCMGVWIEISSIRPIRSNMNVTPCMRVWIEVSVKELYQSSYNLIVLPISALE